MVEREEPRSYFCWGCEYFKPDDPETVRTGECHKNAPTVALDQTGTGVVIVSPSPWPEVEEAGSEFCGEWFRSRREVPDLPGDPA